MQVITVAHVKIRHKSKGMMGTQNSLNKQAEVKEPHFTGKMRRRVLAQQWVMPCLLLINELQITWKLRRSVQTKHCFGKS